MRQAKKPDTQKYKQASFIVCVLQHYWNVLSWAVYVSYHIYLEHCQQLDNQRFIESQQHAKILLKQPCGLFVELFVEN